MIPLRNRTKFVFCLATGLLFLSLLYSCTPPQTEPPKTEPKPDARADLLSALKGANVDGFNFAIEEDEKQEIVSLTNGATRNPITLDGGTTSVVLRYATVKDKKTNGSRTYKTEAVKTGTEVALLVTDIATGAVVTKEKFLPVEPHLPTGPTFNSINECIADFNCKRRGALECEANRTCKPQFAALTCCLKDGHCFSVHLIIRPTRRICDLIGPFPDIEGLVLSQ